MTVKTSKLSDAITDRNEERDTPEKNQRKEPRATPSAASRRHEKSTVLATRDELPDNKYFIFGKEGGKQLALEMDIPLLAQLPLIQSIREAGDGGRPAVMQEGTVARKELDLMISNLEETLSKLD